VSIKTLIIAVAITLSSCATTVPVVAKLPIPPRPDFPPVPAAELMCLSDQVYADLVLIVKLWMNHVTTLENIIGSTH
jgi:hypothetical protein